MLEAIVIRDFQSHRKTALRLAPGVNVVSGPSDSGKTAIARAIGWALFNRPSGEAFRRRGGKTTKVTLRFDDGKLARVRTNKKNLYRVDGEVLQAVGKSVPDEVTKRANVGPLNIQTQHDAPFLLSTSPAEVGRQLNEVADLQAITTALQTAGTMVRRFKEGLSAEELAVARLDHDLEQFKGLSDLEGRANVLTTVAKQATLKMKKTIRLRNAVIDLERAERAVHATPDAGRALRLLKEVQEVNRKAEKAGRRARHLTTLLWDLETTEANWRATCKEQEEVKRKIPNVCPTCLRPMLSSQPTGTSGKTPRRVG